MHGAKFLATMNHYAGVRQFADWSKTVGMCLCTQAVCLYACTLTCTSGERSFNATRRLRQCQTIGWHNWHSSFVSFFVRVLLLLSCPSHIFPHLRAHAFDRFVTVARSSPEQASSSRRQERRWAIVCGSPQSQSMTERLRDSPISSSLFSHGPPLCAAG